MEIPEEQIYNGEVIIDKTIWAKIVLGIKSFNFYRKDNNGSLQKNKNESR